MKKYIKPLVSVALLLFILLFIIFEFKDVSISGMLRLTDFDMFHLMSSLVIVFYLLSRIYYELLANDRQVHIVKLVIYVSLSVFILSNNILVGDEMTLSSIRFSVLYRFVTLIGMMYIVEHQVADVRIHRLRTGYFVVLAFLNILLFLFTVEMLPVLVACYYGLVLSYIMVVNFYSSLDDHPLHIIKRITMYLLMLALVNDMIVVLYQTSIELSFMMCALAIVLMYTNKVIHTRLETKRYKEEIKSLNIEVLKLENEKKDLDQSVAVMKRDLSSRFSKKQNYYENLELLVDVLNTNVLVVNQHYSVELSHGNAFNNDETNEMDMSKILFDLFGDEGQYFLSVVKKVFGAEDEVREKLFLSLLDQKLVIHNITYNMNYYIMTKVNREKVLIMHAESSHNDYHSGQEKQDKEVSNMMTAIVRNSEMFFVDLATFIEFSKNITMDLDPQTDIEESIFAILRRVHTFKGVFDQYNMLSTVRGINDIENELFNMLHNTEELTYDQFAKVVIAYDLEGALRTDMMILKHKLGERFFLNKTRLHIDKTEFNRLYLKLDKLLGTEHEIVEEMLKLKDVNLLDVLSSYKEYVDRIAEEQGKKVRFVVTGKAVKVDRNNYIEFFEALIHIMKNSVTHGVEYPDVRKMHGKSEVATITCDINTNGQMIDLSISDDGKGIDVKEIKNRLFILGKYSIEALEELSDETIYNMVIEDGVTSFMTPNHFAGRGVGMGSLKETVEKINGSIQVQSQENLGVTYKIQIPLNQNKALDHVDDMAIIENLCLYTERILTKSDRKKSLSSTWHVSEEIVEEKLLYDVSSVIIAKAYVDRKMIITVDETFLYQLIGSYGLHLKYKGANINVLNEVICRFSEEISQFTIEALKNEQQTVKLEPASIMSKSLFEETFKGQKADVAELDISEGKLRIMVLRSL